MFLWINYRRLPKKWRNFILRTYVRKVKGLAVGLFCFKTRCVLGDVWCLAYIIRSDFTNGFIDFVTCLFKFLMPLFNPWSAENFGWNKNVSRETFCSETTTYLCFTRNNLAGSCRYVTIKRLKSIRLDIVLMFMLGSFTHGWKRAYLLVTFHMEFLFN